MKNNPAAQEKEGNNMTLEEKIELFRRALRKYFELKEILWEILQHHNELTYEQLNAVMKLQKAGTGNNSLLSVTQDLESGRSK